MNNIKMHGAWIQVNYWLNVEKKEPSPSSAVVWCPPPPMCPRYLLTKPPKVMMFSYQYVKIYISTVIQLYIWHCQLFIHDTHFKFFFFFPKWAAQVTMAAHLDPMCYLTAIFILYFFIHQTFGGIFFMFFCIVFYVLSIFPLTLLATISLNLSPSHFYMEKHSWCSTQLQWNLVLIFCALNW